jgi:hypothetical protein
MSPARLILPTLGALLLATGCGSSGEPSSQPSSGQTATATTPEAPAGAAVRRCPGSVAGTGKVRVTGVACDVGRGVVAAWAGKPSCSGSSGASRFSCGVGQGYRCLGAATERGLAVSCARPGSSVSFIAKSG